MENDAVFNFSELMSLGALAPALSGLLERLEKLAAQFDAIRTPPVEGFSDPWLTAGQARVYLGNMAKGTFDKYRYETSPRLPGHKLDGKVLYKRSDLDNFVRLYELKSKGVA
jgi:hypothetical protein